MAKPTNPITKYFRKEKIVDNVEENDKMSSGSSSIDDYDNEPLSTKRVRLDKSLQSTSSSIITSPLQSTSSSTITSPLQSTSSSTITSSLQSTSSSIITSPRQSTSSSIITSPLQSTSSSTITSSLQSTSSSIITSSLHSTNNSPTRECTISSSSSIDRDPCLGPAKAKEHLITGPFQPKTKFPTVNNRHFRGEWYDTYPWLEYSLKLDRAFCFPCRLRNDIRFETAFIITGFNQWKNGVLGLNRHQASATHKESFERWKTTIRNYDNNTNVLKSLDQQYSKQALENRVYLKELIRTIHFLARQGLSCKLFDCLYRFIYRNIGILLST